MLAVYEKTYESRILRIEHKIRLWSGVSVSSILTAFQHMPVNIQLKDVEEDDGTTTLVFLEERAEPQAAAIRTEVASSKAA